jgi:hypothetical protein
MIVRTFTAADQEAFAALSGDRNPIHMDAEAARRTQAGRPAVHGIAATLWALETIAAEVDLRSLSTLKVEFHSFIPVGELVTFAATGRALDRLSAEIRRDGVRALSLDLWLAEAPSSGSTPTTASPPEPVPTAPLDRSLRDLAGTAGNLAAPPGSSDRASALYPGLVAAIGPAAVVSLALTSALVGMVAPGLHSIFSGFSLRLRPNEQGFPALAWRTARADERFRLVTLEVAAPGIAGSLRAFARFPPVAPPRLAHAAQLVPTRAFAGRRALVVGGSRGLGAATALLLAAGGAAVTLTWRSSRAEADALVNETAGACEIAKILAYDALAPASPQLEGLTFAPTHVYYFATGPIGAGAGPYLRSRLESFLAIYIDGFHDLVTALLARYPGQPLRVFYPSTIFVEERPAGLAEYAMAKAAGEILATDLARAHRGLSIEVHRLPRVLTDQTAVVPPVPAADPLSVMAPLLLSPSDN